MSSGPFLRQIPRHGGQQRRPVQIGRIQAIVPDVGGPMPRRGRCPACRPPGINMGLFTVPPIGAGVWIEFERRRSRLSDLGRRLLGQRRPRRRLSRTRCRPGLAGITLQTTLKNGIVISDMPGPTGGILIQTTTGRHDLGQRRRHHHRNGKGAIITHDRTDDRREHRRADRRSSRRHRMPAPILHLGATVICTHAGPGDAAGASFRACWCRDSRWSR